jgi:hypothetical protein
MTENPVDPVHDDHDAAADETPGDTGENPDGSHDQDADPPTALGTEPVPETRTVHPDPAPGDDGT